VADINYDNDNNQCLWGAEAGWTVSSHDDKWSASCGNDERCSSSLFDWNLCISEMKSSSGTVGALAVALVDGSSLRCSLIRAPYTHTDTNPSITMILQYCTKFFLITMCNSVAVQAKRQIYCKILFKKISIYQLYFTNDLLLFIARASICNACTVR